MPTHGYQRLDLQEVKMREWADSQVQSTSKGN